MYSYQWLTPLSILCVLTFTLCASSQENAFYQDLMTPHEIQIRAKQKYCGRHLVDVLQLVCESNYYQPLKRNKGDYLKRHDTEEDSDMMISSEFARSLLAKRAYQVRGITDECCRKGCSYNELKSYCAEEA